MRILIILAALFLHMAGAWAQSCPGGIPSGITCIAPGQTTDVDRYGTCRRLRNPQSLAVMVPWGKAAEWQSVVVGSAAGLLTAAPCYSYAWSGWGGWSGCSASCGGGSQSRTRECRRTEANVGGYTVVDASYCGGSATESQSCNTQSCCTPSARVDGYGGCSASCGGGSQTVYWSDGCGGTWTSSQSCNTQGCCSIEMSASSAPSGSACGTSFHLRYNNCSPYYSEHWWTGSCPYAAQFGQGNRVFWEGGMSSLDISNGCDDGNRRGCTEHYCVYADGQSACATLDFNY